MSAESQKLSCSYAEKLIALIYSFLDHQLNDYRQQGFFLCLSGGIDSSTLLKLVVDRYGSRRIKCLITKLQGHNSDSDIKDAELLCNELGVEYFIYDITLLCSSFIQHISEMQTQPLDNIASRIRVGIACELSVKYNKRLLFAGPYTDWVLKGDPIGGAIAHCYPFAGLYKSEIYAIASAVGLPSKFLLKKPSNSGSFDKTKIYLGFSLGQIDKIVAHLNGLLPRQALPDISDKHLMYFEYCLRLFEPDVDIRSFGDDIDLNTDERRRFLQELSSLPFENKDTLLSTITKV